MKKVHPIMPCQKHVNDEYTRITYKSRMKEKYNNSITIKNIVSKSLINNKKNNISGEIFYNSINGTIIQIIEGKTACINQLFLYICKDKRHYNIRELENLPILYKDLEYTSWNLNIVNNTIDKKVCINDYIITSIIGNGGFSTVVKGKHRNLNTYHAIKIISKNRMNANTLKNIKDERDIMINLSHVYISKLYHCLQDPCNIYFIMELVTRGDMYSCTTRNDLTNEAIEFYYCEILCGINYLHKEKIIFGDLKLENILINHKGHILLTDFGISKKENENNNKLRGTPVYFSPEMIMYNDISNKSDIWALGIILYELIIGNVPWQGMAKEIMFNCILNTQLVIDININTNIMFDDLIQYMNNYDKNDRYTSVQLIEFVSTNSIYDWNDIENNTIEPPILPEINNGICNEINNFEI